MAAAKTKSEPRIHLEIIQVPGWKSIPWLVHGFSTRAGGATTIYSADRATNELNLGYTPADTRAHVDRNRKTFLREVAGQQAATMKLVTLRQIHSGLIHQVAAGGAPLQGDGLVTNLPGAMLGIQTADCVPILIVDPVQRVVAAFHAGWRGTVKRMVERGAGLMRARYGSDPAKLLAAIGPAIGACCYSVGEEVVAEFDSQFSYSKELFREVFDSDPVKKKYPMLFLTARAPGHSDIGPQIHLDLAEANRRQLLDGGLRAKNIWVSSECTKCNPEKYFSHRGEQGFTGRMMAVVGICPRS
jgi:YfiH family protein